MAIIEVIEALPLYPLAAGIFAMWIFYGLTFHLKPSIGEQILLAFIFTLFANIPKFLMEELLILVRAPQFLAVSQFSAVLLYGGIVGVVAAWFYNYDFIHRFLRWAGITEESIYPSGWALMSSREEFIVLHLDNGNKIYGWPDYYPNSPKDNYFIMSDYVWLNNEDDPPCPNTTKTSLGKIKIPCNTVIMVEFIKK